MAVASEGSVIQFWILIITHHVLFESDDGLTMVLFYPYLF